LAGDIAAEVFGPNAESPKAPRQPALSKTRLEIPSHSVGDRSVMASMKKPCKRMFQSPR
jgi:hypothetical protein